MPSKRKFALGCLPVIVMAALWLASAVRQARNAAMKTTDVTSMARDTCANATSLFAMSRAGSMMRGRRAMTGTASSSGKNGKYSACKPSRIVNPFSARKGGRVTASPTRQTTTVIAHASTAGFVWSSRFTFRPRFRSSLWNRFVRYPTEASTEINAKRSVTATIDLYGF